MQSLHETASSPGDIRPVESATDIVSPYTAVLNLWDEIADAEEDCPLGVRYAFADFILGHSVSRAMPKALLEWAAETRQPAPCESCRAPLSPGEVVSGVGMCQTCHNGLLDRITDIIGPSVSRLPDAESTVLPDDDNELTLYQVTFEIDVSAHSPEEAHRYALEDIRDEDLGDDWTSTVVALVED